MTNETTPVDRRSFLGGSANDLGVAIAPDAYCFVPERRFLDPRISAFIVPPVRNVELFRTTRNFTNYRVVDNRIFFGSTDGRIYALDRATGKKVWDYEAGGSFIAAPAVAANRLLIASEDGILYCLGAAHGH